MAKLSTLLLALVLLTPGRLAADAQISEWIGDYAMNHDGFHGTLRIVDSKRDCAAPAWCHLVASYVDDNRASHRVVILAIDQAFQHMAFTIEFPGNRQRFDGYLMSWDKARLAGTTVWQGRTFGFYAFKNAPLRILPLTLPGRGGRGIPPVTTTPSVSSGSSGSRTIAADGSIQTVLPDGRRKITRPGQCGFTIVNPDGTATNASCAQVQPATPPLPDSVSSAWLEGHSGSLLDVIRALVGNDQASVDNYLRNEPMGSTIYDRIYMRTDLIAKLTEP